MTIREIKEIIAIAKVTAQNNTEITIATRADEALRTGIHTAELIKSLGKCPDMNTDFDGWDAWKSDYNELAKKRARYDGILAVCLEAMGQDYNEIQDVIVTATYNKEI